MGFGAEIPFIFVLGALLFGPKRLTAILGRVARAKAQFENAARSFKSQTEAELSGQNRDGQTDSFQQMADNR